MGMTTRKALRLAQHDYRSPGAYFVTVCASKRGCVFGTLHGDKVILGLAGQIVADHLCERIDRVGSVSVDVWIVMPDHVHAVLVLERDGRLLGPVIGSFKSATTREISRRCSSCSPPVWQRGYYDHVVRNDTDLDRVREYIVTNPLRSALRAVS